MFELQPDNNETISDEEFHLSLDALLGNVAEVFSDKEIDPAYFATPWAQVKFSMEPACLT